MLTGGRNYLLASRRKIITALVKKKYGPETVPASASMILQGNMPVNSSVAAAMPTRTTLSGQPSRRGGGIEELVYVSFLLCEIILPWDVYAGK